MGNVTKVMDMEITRLSVRLTDDERKQIVRVLRKREDRKEGNHTFQAFAVEALMAAVEKEKEKRDGTTS